MNPIDVIRIATKSFSERKLRAVLTIIGIAIGPLALVMISSVTQGYSKYIVTQIESLGQNLIAVFPSGDYDLTQQDLDFMRSIPGVARAEPFYSTQGRIKIGAEEKDIYIYALPIDFLLQAVSNLEIKEGDIPGPTEAVKVVVGYNIAYDENGNSVYRLGDVISITVMRIEPGGKVKFKRVSVIISGILDKYGGAMFLNPDDTIFMNLDAGEKLIGMKKWSGILILVEDSSLVENIATYLRNTYRNSVEIVSFLAIARIASSITNAVNFMTFAASLAAFAVAIAGVAATMITSVIERTKEIGVMKALGFTDRQVLTLILTESLLMSILGGIIGISLGVIGAYALASRGLTISSGTAVITINAHPEINAVLIARTALLTMFVGVIGGLFPAYRAAKIPPAVALRYE